ncbi:MAG: hypothetical protein CMJ48_15080 [Planctomycetaceae bacterium]|nr:hypothetical protein [Planctomycetaceae bacterium]
MSTPDLLWRWLIHAAVLCGLGLIVGAVATRFVRRPADRLRLIQWVLIGCLLAPCVGGLSTWRSLSIDLVDVASTDVPASFETEPQPDDVTGADERPVVTDATIARKPTDDDPPRRFALTQPAPVPAPVRKDVTNEDSVANAQNAPASADARVPQDANAKTALPALGFTQIRHGAVIAYLFFVALIGTRWLAGWLRLTRLKRRAVPASAELRRLFDGLAGDARKGRTRFGSKRRLLGGIGPDDSHHGRWKLCVRFPADRCPFRCVLAWVCATGQQGLET